MAIGGVLMGLGGAGGELGWYGEGRIIVRSAGGRRHFHKNGC